MAHEAPDAAQVQEGLELGAVPERPGGGEDGVAQPDSPEIDGGVDAAHGSASQATASAANIGPSRQSSANPPAASGTAQPRQTPKPQAI